MKTIDELKKLNPVYAGDFTNKEDIERKFEIKLSDDIHIVYAEYGTEDWEGFAFVICIKDNKLYEVFGSHCSCYGLEGQWDMEETSIEVLAYRFVNNNSHHLLKNCHYLFDDLSEQEIKNLREKK